MPSRYPHATSIIITPDARLATVVANERMLDEKQSISAGNRSVSYSLFVSILLRHLGLMRDARQITFAERQLLLQLVLRDSGLGWPIAIRRTTLGSYLGRLFGEWKALALAADQLEQKYRAARDSVPPELYEPLWLSWLRYQRLLSERSCYDREDAEVALVKTLEKADVGEVMRQSFGVFGQAIGFIEVRHFLWPTMLQNRLFQTLRHAYGVNFVCENNWLERETPFINQRDLILEGYSKRAASEEIALQGGDAVQILQADDPRVECRAIVSLFKQALREGLPSSSCGLVLDDDTVYREHLLREFQEQGVPFDMLCDVRLSEEPLCRALLQMLQAALNLYEINLPALLREPLLNPSAPTYSNLALRIAEQWPLSGGTASMERWLRRWELLGSGQALLFSDAEDAENTQAMACNSDFWVQGQQALLIWQKRLVNLASARKIGDLLSSLQADMKQLGWPHRAIPRGLPLDEALQARRRVEAIWEALQQILSSIETFVESRGGTLQSFTDALQLVFSQSVLRLTQGQVGGVQVLPETQLPGRNFRMLVVARCVGGRYPEERSSDWLLGERARSLMGLPDAFSEAVRQRERFAAIFSSAEEKLVFSWPLHSERGALEQCSAFVNRLAMAPGSAQRVRVERQPSLDRSMSATQWRRALLTQFREQPEKLTTIWDENPLIGAWYPQEERGVMQQQIKVRRRQHEAPQAFVAPDANTHQALRQALNRRLEHFQYSVSSLQAYKDCPYRFLVEKLLALRPLGEIRDRLRPTDRGLLYHRIVQELLAPSCLRKPALVDLSSDLWSERLDELLHAFWRRPSEVQMSSVLWNLELRKARSILNRWLGLERQRARTPNIVCEWAFGGAVPELEPCPQAETCSFCERSGSGQLLCQRAPQWSDALYLERDGRILRLKGVVDRIDDLGGGVHLIDYKSGQVGEHTLAALVDMRDIQLPIYALAWDQQHRAHPAQVVSYVFIEQKDAAKSITMQRLSEPFKNRAGIDLSWRDYSDLLQQHLFDLDGSIRNGEFQAEPRKEIYCSYCPLRGLCPRGDVLSREEGDDAVEGRA